MIQAIVFDMDGVLVDSTPSHARAFAEVLEKIGVTDFDYSLYAGERTPDVFRRIAAERGLELAPERIEEMSRVKSARAQDLMAENDCFMPEYKLVLETLSARYPLALASSASSTSVEAFLERGGVRALFGSVLSGDDVERAKPDPEIYARSFAQLKAPPERCAVVEDARSGIVAGRLAGAGMLIGFERRPEERHKLTEAGAGPVIGALRDLLALFAAPAEGVKA